MKMKEMALYSLSSPIQIFICGRKMNVDLCPAELDNIRQALGVFSVIASYLLESPAELLLIHFIKESLPQEGHSANLGAL